MPTETITTRRARLQALLDAATPGPWKNDTKYGGDAVVLLSVFGDCSFELAEHENDDDHEAEHNFAFCAAARNELQSLLDSEERLEVALREMIEEFQGSPDTTSGTQSSDRQAVLKKARAALGDEP